jgi:hypothetical protein
MCIAFANVTIILLETSMHIYLVQRSIKLKTRNISMLGWYNNNIKLIYTI